VDWGVVGAFTYDTTKVFSSHSGSAKRCRYETAPILLAGFLQQNEGVNWGYGSGVCSVGCPKGAAGRDGGVRRVI